MHKWLFWISQAVNALGVAAYVLALIYGWRLVLVIAAFVVLGNFLAGCFYFLLRWWLKL